MQQGKYLTSVCVLHCLITPYNSQNVEGYRSYGAVKDSAISHLLTSIHYLSCHLAREGEYHDMIEHHYEAKGALSLDYLGEKL